MYNFLSKARILSSIRGFRALNPKSQHLQTQRFSVSSNEHSFAVSYLINNCGLPPKSAISASRRVELDNPKRADSVLRFFDRHGFSKNVVSDIVSKFPEVLSCHPGRTLLPKVEFFYSKGVCKDDLADLLASNPTILQRSLKHCVVPIYEFVNSLFKSEEKTNDAIRRYPLLLDINLDSYVEVNIRTMLDIGVSGSVIAMLLRYRPRVFNADPDAFRETVEEVKEMGFVPGKSSFVVAVWAKRSMTKLTWEKKVDAYKKWGWSEKEVLEAFGRYPWCMTKSKDKIDAVMEYFIGRLGWESSDLAKNPKCISYSLQKRIKPRVVVIQFLLSKGLISEAVSWSSHTLFDNSEKLFLQKFVKNYEEEAPQLLKLYNETIKSQLNR